MILDIEKLALLGSHINKEAFLDWEKLYIEKLEDRMKNSCYYISDPESVIIDYLYNKYSGG